MDLRYEARDVDQNITSQAKIDQWFDSKTSGLTDVALAELKKRWGTLKFSSIFGANASGKSNLVKAIKYAQATIVKGTIKNINVSSFKLDKSYEDKNSYFEFEMVINNKNYNYEFEMNIHKKQFVSYIEI